MGDRNRRTQPRRIRLAGGAVLVALAATACAGPTAPLDVGTQTVPLSLVLGELKAVQEAPVGPLSEPPAPQALPYPQRGVPLAGQLAVPPPPPPPDPDVVIPPGPCPQYDPGAPVLAVGRAIDAPPAKATYRYRGTVLDVYADKSSAFIGDSAWTVQPGPVDAVTGAYDVTYTVKLGDATTTRVFRILPRDIGADEGADPVHQTNPNAIVEQINAAGLLPNPLPPDLPNLSPYGLAGIYLVSQKRNGVTFRPSVPIAVLQLRQLTGAAHSPSATERTITSVGYDPVAQAAMAFRSTVTSVTEKINACGTPLQAVQVTLDSPNAPTTQPPTLLVPTDPAVYAEKAPTSDPAKPRAHVLLFKEKIAFGLQYGGLVLHDESVVGPLHGYRVDGEDPPPPPKSIDQSGLFGAFVAWYVKHRIVKQSSFTINQQPTMPKRS